MSNLVVYRWFNEKANRTEYLVRVVTREGNGGFDEGAMRLLVMQNPGVKSIALHEFKGEIVDIVLSDSPTEQDARDAAKELTKDLSVKRKERERKEREAMRGLGSVVVGNGA